MTTANIFRSAKSSNFTVVDNRILCDNSLSSNARLILAYLLSKPENWKMRINDLRHIIGIGRDRIYRCLNELRDAGHAVMIRLQRGVRWQFYEKPVRLPEIQHTEAQYNIVNTDLITKKEQLPVVVDECVDEQAQPTPVVVDTAPMTESVVVSDDLLINVPEVHKPAARKVIKNCPAKDINPVLACWIAAMAKGDAVRNPIGYLQSLVQASQNGTFYAPPSMTTKPSHSLEERVRQQKEKLNKREKIDYNTWLASVKARFGDAVKFA